MPFKEKIKKALGRPGSSNSSSTSLHKLDSRKDSSVYGPDDPMPRMKYRQPPSKHHKAMLEAFTFGDSSRRKSQTSLYSPYGSRMPSRNNSIDKGDKSFGGGGAMHIESVPESSNEDSDSSSGP